MKDGDINMVHTFSLNKVIDASAYREYIELLRQYSLKTQKPFFCNLEEKYDDVRKISSKSILFTGFKHRGVSIYITKISGSKSNFINYILKIIVNPKRYESSDYVSTADELCTRKALDGLNGILMKIGIPYNYEDFNVSRVDCCMNYQFDNYDNMKLYLRLLKKCDVLKHFEVYSTYSQRAKRNVIPKNSLYHRCKSVRINIYDKYSQLTGIEKKVKIKNISSVKGTLRFEIQCLGSKLKSSMKRLNVDSRAPKYFLKNTFTDYILIYYLTKLYGEGDFYTYEETKLRIEGSKFNEASKILMLKILRETSRRGSVKRAREYLLVQGYSYVQIKRCLKRFNKLGINVITVPSSTGIKILPNPVKLLCLTKREQGTIA